MHLIGGIWSRGKAPASKEAGKMIVSLPQPCWVARKNEKWPLQPSPASLRISDCCLTKRASAVCPWEGNLWRTTAYLQDLINSTFSCFLLPVPVDIGVWVSPFEISCLFWGEVYAYAVTLSWAASGSWPKQKAPPATRTPELCLPSTLSPTGQGSKCHEPDRGNMSLQDLDSRQIFYPQRESSGLWTSQDSSSSNPYCLYWCCCIFLNFLESL